MTNTAPCLRALPLRTLFPLASQILTAHVYTFPNDDDGETEQDPGQAGLGALGHKGLCVPHFLVSRK